MDKRNECLNVLDQFDICECDIEKDPFPFETNRIDVVYSKSVLEHIVHPDTGKIKSHFHILLNGRDIESLKGLDEKVMDGDTITCVPPVGGG